ncbi:hypothetical protein AcV7_010398 [Taiwanofungus camphoratus]|nr:hypothetical protein AcV7_010398 [Antrodia cinnamomea]
MDAARLLPALLWSSPPPPEGIEQLPRLCESSGTMSIDSKRGPLEREYMSLPLNTTREGVLQAALTFSLTDGFIDTEIYVFSRRTVSGYVDKARPVLANSIALRTISPHFDRMLTGGFSESIVTRLEAAFDREQRVPVEVYGYESDSDLEDEDDDNDDGQRTWPAHQDGSVHTCNGNGDRIAMEQNIMSSSSTKSNEKADKLMNENSHDLGKEQCAQKTEVGASERTGRRVFVKDSAFNTWKAFVFYIYTGKIVERTRLYRPPPCSPKSMYRLADKYDLQELRQLAIDDIRSKLSADNILTELFSRFTSRYPEIQQLQVDFISTHSLNASVLATMPQWIERVVQGDLPHSGTALIYLIQKLANKPATQAVVSPNTPATGASGVYRSHTARRGFTKY